MSSIYYRVTQTIIYFHMQNIESENNYTTDRAHKEQLACKVSGGHFTAHLEVETLKHIISARFVIRNPLLFLHSWQTMSRKWHYSRRTNLVLRFQYGDIHSPEIEGLF